MDKKLLKKKLESKGFSKASYQSRSISFNDIPNFEIRESLIDQRIIEGYAVIWGSVNSHREKFTRGAFAKSIRELGPSSNSNFKIKFRDEHGRACSLFLLHQQNQTYLESKVTDMAFLYTYALSCLALIHLFYCFLLSSLKTPCSMDIV